MTAPALDELRARAVRLCVRCGGPVPPGRKRGPHKSYCSRACSGNGCGLSPIERFMLHVHKTETCWLWTASSSRGYGNFRHAGVMCSAHRVAYELFVGPIPEGLTVDHVRARGCTSTLCVNPAHLEPVTQRENTLRGDTLPARNAAKTTCKYGHPLVVVDNKRGRRGCRPCTTEKDRRKAARRYAEACKDPVQRERLRAKDRRSWLRRKARAALLAAAPTTQPPGTEGV